MRKFITVALVGEPNVGKSTLVNAMVGEKISIVTHKVQTTRNNIKGIVQHGETQMVLIDSPGIFSPSRTLEKAIVKNAMSALDAADIICVLFDARNLRLEAFEMLKDHLRKKKCYAVINKIDLVRRDATLPMIEKINELKIFQEIFPISAQEMIGVENLKNFIAERANQGEWLFDPEQLTDTSERSIAEELTREKAFLFLHQEIPYSLKVETDKWEEKEDGSLAIHQTIFVTKESQKVIILGKGGEKIKEIGRKARHEISNVMQRKVHLFLFVKVRENWIEKDFS